MDEIYCPICEKWISAHNKEAVKNGDEKCWIFVHSDIIHSDEDIEALENGIQ